MSASPPFTLDRLVRDVADVLYTEPADVSWKRTCWTRASTPSG